MYFLLTSDGQRIAVHAYGPREAEESVVMLHGWWMNHRVFEAAVGSLLHKKSGCSSPTSVGSAVRPGQRRRSFWRGWRSMCMSS